jgi:hypothetical protein
MCGWEKWKITVNTPNSRNAPNAGSWHFAAAVPQSQKELMEVFMQRIHSVGKLRATLQIRQTLCVMLA